MTDIYAYEVKADSVDLGRISLDGEWRMVRRSILLKRVDYDDLQALIDADSTTGLTYYEWIERSQSKDYTVLEG